MTTDLVRTTSYFHPTLLNLAKKQAIDENRDLYEIFNLALEKFLGVKALPQTKTTTRFNYEDTFGPPLDFKLKKTKLTRADYYE